MAYDLNPAITAVKTLYAFPAQINTASSSLNGISLGPWIMSVNCSYGACNRGQLNYTKVVDFTDSRVGLQNTLQGISNQTQQFIGDLQPKLQLLQQLSGQIIGSLNDLKNFLSQHPSVADKSLVVASLNSISQAITAKSQVLATENQAIGVYGQALHDQTSTLANQNNALQTQINDLAFSIQNYANTQPCGGDQSLMQLNNFKSIFYGAYNNINTLLQTLYSQSQQTENAMNVLIGTFSIFITQWNSGTEDIIKATDQVAYNTALGLMDISIAILQWQALSDEFNQLIH